MNVSLLVDDVAEHCNTKYTVALVGDLLRCHYANASARDVQDPLTSG